MVKVTLDDVVLADSTDTVVVEGNHYFRLDDVKTSFMRPSDTSTICPWKGTASYYTANVDGKVIEDIAWYYPSTKEKAKNIEGRVAFYKNKAEITE